jgi:histidine phosphotransfer protein HptB
LENDLPSPPYTSSLAHHPDVREVLPLFVARLRGQVEALRRLQERGEMENLRIVVHQLRGAGASFGFERMTDLAGKLEEHILAADSPAAIAVALQALTAYMQRIEGY